MKIIINADDLGLNREVNDAIFILMAERRITSATLLANGPAVREAAQRVTEFPHCSFGVHLNLSEFRPLTVHPGLRPILAENGCFAGNRLREITLTHALRLGIFQEWSAQVERLQSLGVRLSHFDSHHHMHTVPGVFPVMKRLQHRFGFRKVRLTMNLYLPDAPASRARLSTKAAWNFALRHWHRTTTTRRLTSFEIFSRTPKEKLRGCESVELMVHPGSADYAQETQLLWTDWLKELPFPAQCISYNEL